MSRLKLSNICQGDMLLRGEWPLKSRRSVDSVIWKFWLIQSASAVSGIVYGVLWRTLPVNLKATPQDLDDWKVFSFVFICFRDPG